MQLRLRKVKKYFFLAVAETFVLCKIYSSRTLSDNRVLTSVIQEGEDRDQTIQLRRSHVRSMMIFYLLNHYIFALEMMAHAWAGYKRFAWGENEVRPVSRMANRGSILGGHHRRLSR